MIPKSKPSPIYVQGVYVPRQINKSRFYQIEKQAFNSEYQILVTNGDARKITTQLIKYLHQEKVKLKFNRRRRQQTGLAERKTRIIHLPYNPSIGLLVHELTHVLTDSGHTIRGLLMMEKLILFLRKKNLLRASAELRYCCTTCNFTGKDATEAANHFTYKQHSYKIVGLPIGETLDK